MRKCSTREPGASPDGYKDRYYYWVCPGCAPVHPGPLTPVYRAPAGTCCEGCFGPIGSGHRRYYVFKFDGEWIVWRPASEIYVALDWADAVDYVRARVDAGA